MTFSYPWSGTPSSPTTPHPPPHLAPFCLVNIWSLSRFCCLHLLFGKHCMPLQLTLVNQSPVIYLSQSQTHAQSCSTIGQCLLYSLSHTAVSLVCMHAVDKGLRGQNVLHQLLLILLCICSRSVCLIYTIIVTGCSNQMQEVYIAQRQGAASALMQFAIVCCILLLYYIVSKMVLILLQLVVYIL